MPTCQQDGDLVPGITAHAQGPLEMREVIRHHAKLGVDQIKLSMSGKQICDDRDALHDCYFTDEETAACVNEARRHGLRVCAHARARDSVKMCVRHGVDVIYHASWIDDEGMDLLAKNKHKHVVAPGLNWLVATSYEAVDFGYSLEQAEKDGYKRELDAAVQALREMHRRGILVLPGGDYGFAWTPHGTYARDLEHFVTLLGFSAMEAVVAATAGVAKLFMREDELGMIKNGFLADCILVDGEPLYDISVLQDVQRINVILINERIHKASHHEFFEKELAAADMDTATSNKLTNFITYRLDDGTNRTRVGHLNQVRGTITPVSFTSGTPIETLFQLIEVGEENIIAGGDPFAYDVANEVCSSNPKASVDVLAPLSGRDVLAIGKNYSEHAKEFNASGYDSSDKVDMPTHPVVFTKRSTSIVAHGEDILLHEGFTETLDYEGEIGVIIGKTGFNIPEAEAENHVWGFTIINDVTAREKQRDHKQFFIGKSGDGYCPMGPVAVPKSALPKTLTIETHVNGEFRQRGTTEDLIFSIPTLIKTISQAQTIRPGDVIATGTPAGVGFGLKPPVFLKPGDVVEISVTGLGTLRNKVEKADAENHVTTKIAEESTITVHNLAITNGGVGLTSLPNGKQLNATKIGSGPNTMVFIHGLGGSSEFFSPLLHKLDLSAYTNLLFDLEGHGLSPTKATSKLTLASYTEDVRQLLQASVLPTEATVTIVAHSMGCLVALLLASQNPGLVKTLVLLGPPPAPLPAAAVEANLQRAATVRKEGLRNVAISVARAATSAKTQAERSLSLTAVQMSLLSQDPEGYAKGCTALAGARNFNVDLGKIGKTVKKALIVTGAEDKVSTPAHVEKMAAALGNAEGVVLPDVGHWHVFEDVEGVSKALSLFL